MQHITITENFAELREKRSDEGGVVKSCEETKLLLNFALDRGYEG